MDQARSPLLEALLRHARAGYVPLHLPAHKQGRWSGGRLPGPGRRWAALDFTELPGLDDLHLPTGPILEAQALAADALGADQAFFLVGGSTAGVQAMILAACFPDDVLLLPRHAHPSAVGGLVWSGARPVYLRPQVDEGLGLALGLDGPELEAGLARARQVRAGGARAVLLVDPTYWGLAGPLAELCALARGGGCLILVDAAHGGHFRFHPGLPRDALAAGADLCVYGFHKTAGSLTQTAVLCRRGGGVDPARVSLALKLLQTSSPSYPLLASLDAARRELAVFGPGLLGRAMEAADWARSRLSLLPGLSCPGPDLVGRPGVAGFDRLKLVVHLRQEGWGGRSGAGPDGTAVAAALRERFRVQVEMAQGRNLLAVVGPGEGRAGVAELVRSLGRLVAVRGRGEGHGAARGRAFPTLATDAHRACLRLMRLTPAQPLTPRQAILGPCREVWLEEAQGEVSAELVSLHPPGQVVLFPGEEILPEAVDALRLLRRAGIAPQGAADPTLRRLRVAAGG
ncbi:MAG: aminotransferase class I/II-fold pyridoxal phosphate-dependent enzyme [Acetobacteraceae bacterium]|nr:aminotransferase class I/II-fold pyridoxal phosphate-dependent enzyme [Acetobacteraceae bacterium]